MVRARVRSVSNQLSNNTKKCCVSGHIHIMSYSVNPKQTEGRFVSKYGCGTRREFGLRSGFRGLF